MDLVVADKPWETVKANTYVPELKPVEVEVIQFFVQFAAAVGQPRSVAEIYGLLFVSEKPLPMDTVIERLKLSKGSASQGLKYLQDLGAVRTVYVASDRRTHFDAVTELRQLAGRFLRRQILTPFEDSASRMDRIAAQTRALSGEQRKHILDRIRLLRRWERAGRRILPLVAKMLDGD
jgi:DNA-binding transcriptional regulator GbsR (MarR family)